MELVKAFKGREIWNSPHFQTDHHRVKYTVKMFAKICPVCKTKFCSENKKMVENWDINGDCYQDNKSNDKFQRPVRTSTPVSDGEYCSSPSFSDSVTDFFYQSWKSGLHSDDSSSLKSSSKWNHQGYVMLQPVCYVPHVVYVNTVIFQPYIPTSYVQQVGYRPDGTFGVLPTYWS